MKRLVNYDSSDDDEPKTETDAGAISSSFVIKNKKIILKPLPEEKVNPVKREIRSKELDIDEILGRNKFKKAKVDHPNESVNSYNNHQNTVHKALESIQHPSEQSSIHHVKPSIYQQQSSTEIEDPLPEQDEETDFYKEMEAQNLGEKALHALGIRAKGPVKIKTIDAKSLLPSIPFSSRKEAEHISSFDKLQTGRYQISTMAKTNNHIMYLAGQAKAMEQELNEKYAAQRVTRKEVNAKYGF